ncbi:MAG: NAD(P)-binding protein, partial [archaeon]|nr:NAD(P)-binding protein [archaeon]
MEHDYEYIVIGGGICGFEIGALCSTIGKVLLLEKTSSIGGRARVVDKNGFKLDWGGHPVRFGKKSSIAQTMRDIGVDIEFINPGISYAYLANGERHIFPSGIKGIIKTKMISKLQLVKVVIDLLKRMKKDKTKLLETS